MAVKAVIADADRRQLLVRRSAHCRNFVGVWEWPGGKLDPGEDFSTGLAREVREECGLEVEFTGLAGASEFEMPAARVVLLCMHARITGGALRLSDEHDDFAWVAPEEMATWDVIEPMRPVMEQVNAQRLKC
jgi:8-oxo-dGTP diphosphatase